MGTAHRGSIDLLLTDMVMPRMGGRRLAEELHRARPQLKVLYTSGFPEKGVLEPSEANQHFLPKPFTLIDLARRVRLILDQPA